MKQPGDVLASAMEYMPGKGVYEDNGELIAGVCGIVKEDTENMIISIEPSVSVPVEVKEGDKDAKKVMESLKNFLEAGGGPQVIVTVDGYALTSHITTMQRRQAQNPSTNTGTDSRDASRNLSADTE